MQGDCHLESCPKKIVYDGNFETQFRFFLNFYGRIALRHVNQVECRSSHMLNQHLLMFETCGIRYFCIKL